MKPQPSYPSDARIAGRPMMGGMGIVYLCHDLEKDRPVALKTFKPQFLPDLTAAVESSLNLDRKLELALPLLPLLTYKIELGVGSELDLHALWESLVERFGQSGPPAR